MGFLSDRQLLLYVGGLTSESGFWSIENMFELVKGGWDIGGSRFRRFALLLVKLLPGPKDIGVALLTFPNWERSPAFGG
jgi:hypothetical protein